MLSESDQVASREQQRAAGGSDGPRRSVIVGDHLAGVEVRAVAGRHLCAPSQAVARAAAHVARAKNRVGHDVVPARAGENLDQMPKDAEARVAV